MLFDRLFMIIVLNEIIIMLKKYNMIYDYN